MISSKIYFPQKIERRIYKLWEKSGFFNPDNLGKRKKTYTIAIPPPNITGSLHMGHALNAIIQDILIRQKRMEGYKALWIPGTDHAGIATQNVVEKELKKEGLTRHNLGKEKFIEKIWQWKEKYGNIILDQFKKLGCSCDWSRTRFTMDKDYIKAVETAFFHLYRKNWIYQGERVINWCSKCQTSLSDLELEYEEIKGKLYYIKYPLIFDFKRKKSESSQKYLIVATTRPETMLGDSAVAVHPADQRYKNLIGGEILLPLVNREIPIIADREVKIDFGTGVVKITPSHDFLDFEISQRHNLLAYQVIDFSGKMTKKAGKLYYGLSIKECREKVIEELKKQNLLEKIEDYNLRIPKCYRCKTIIEFQISKQWFLKMEELSDIAKRAVKNKEVKFHPKRWEKVYFDWLKNIKDWCISRQIWWGHRIPLKGTEDVLDTWFSSALWPFAILKWPMSCKRSQKKYCLAKKNTDLEKFYPTQVLSTARDIINLWVTRMIFFSYEFLNKKPFEDVIIHPTILTKEGKRMSKSLGTGIDPIVLIEKYGADATRFGLIFQTMGGQDIHFNEDHVLAGKKFCNKIWNATRFVFQQISNLKIKTPIQIQRKYLLSKEDKKIFKKLEELIQSVDKNIKEYKFGHALHKIYHFFWHTFCDIYIEKSKKNNSIENKKNLLYILIQSLILLHPFMPFITEEIYQKLPIKNKKSFLMIEDWSPVEK